MHYMALPPGSSASKSDLLRWICHPVQPSRDHHISGHIFVVSFKSRTDLAGNYHLNFCQALITHLWHPLLTLQQGSNLYRTLFIFICQNLTFCLFILWKGTRPVLSVRYFSQLSSTTVLTSSNPFLFCCLYQWNNSMHTRPVFFSDISRAPARELIINRPIALIAF